MGRSRTARPRSSNSAKNSADRSKADNTPNGGPQFRGPIEGGATGGSPTPRADRMTGADGAGGFFKFKWDVGGDGKLHLTDVQGGATVHGDWMPGRGIGPGVKDGKPGVAEGDGKGGDVNTPGDASKKAGSSSSASGKSGVPEGLDWSKGTRIKGEELREMKRDIPPAPPKVYNDLGPSTNEPEQKPADTTVAQNNARLGDELAQRI